MKGGVRSMGDTTVAIGASRDTHDGSVSTHTGLTHERALQRSVVQRFSRGSKGYRKTLLRGRVRRDDDEYRHIYRGVSFTDDGLGPDNDTGNARRRKRAVRPDAMWGDD